MVKIFRLLVRGKYLVEKGEVVVIDEYFAKIKYQVLYHIIKNSYIFKYKISITLLFSPISWKESFQSNCKSTKNSGTQGKDSPSVPFFGRME